MRSVSAVSKLGCPEGKWRKPVLRDRKTGIGNLLLLNDWMNSPVHKQGQNTRSGIQCSKYVSLVAHSHSQMRQKGHNWAKSINLPSNTQSQTQMSTTLLINRWIEVTLPAAVHDILTIKSNGIHENYYIKGYVSGAEVSFIQIYHEIAFSTCLINPSKSVKHTQWWTYLVFQHFSSPAVLNKSSP